MLPFCLRRAFLINGGKWDYGIPKTYEHSHIFLIGFKFFFFLLSSEYKFVAVSNVKIIKT